MRSKMKTLKAAAILSGALALAVSSTVIPFDVAHAKKVKCYGIAKAGNNDCANTAGTHSCAGQSRVDYDGGEWKTAKSLDECQAAGGSTESFKGVNPNIKS